MFDTHIVLGRGGAVQMFFFDREQVILTLPPLGHRGFVDIFELVSGGTRPLLAPHLLDTFVRGMNWADL